MLTPIETVYHGYRFRSRLEARWAVFFQTLGVPWAYEPEGFRLSTGEWYLPDFRVTLADGPLWAEVKPDGATSDLLNDFVRGLPIGARATLLHEIPDPDDMADFEGFYVQGMDEYDGTPAYWADHSYQFCICHGCKVIGFQFEGRAARIRCACDHVPELHLRPTHTPPRILAAYDAALAGRDPAEVDILDLLPAIDAAVPDVMPAEIVAALRWSAERDFREADALEEKADAMAARERRCVILRPPLRCAGP